MPRAVSQPIPAPTEDLSGKGHQPGPVYVNGPPFPVSFFMLRLFLNSTFTKEVILKFHKKLLLAKIDV